MFHIIGSGACGFLRLHFLLKDEIPLKYKGGGPKYQNSFQTWNDDGLIWNIEELTDHERLRRVSLQDTTTNITHSYLNYVPEFMMLYPDMKFCALKDRENTQLNRWQYHGDIIILAMQKIEK